MDCCHGDMHIQKQYPMPPYCEALPVFGLFVAFYCFCNRLIRLVLNSTSAE